MSVRAQVTSPVWSGDFRTFFFYSCRPHRDLHSFPTRRSSDLRGDPPRAEPALGAPVESRAARRGGGGARDGRDRKSTRLNSSHVEISYAVFCLKKKKDGSGRLLERIEHSGAYGSDVTAVRTSG